MPSGNRTADSLTSGRESKIYCQVEKATSVEQPKIIDCLWKPFCIAIVLGYLGETCQSALGIFELSILATVDGQTRVFGNRCSKYWLKMQITNMP